MFSKSVMEDEQSMTNRRRQFHARGPATAKASIVAGITRADEEVDRR